MAMCVYRNPSRHRDVANIVISEYKTYRNKWTAIIRETNDIAISYDELLEQLERGIFSAHGLILKIAAEAYQRICKLIADSPDYDVIYSPTNSVNQSTSICFVTQSKNGYILPCVPTNGATAKEHKTLIKRSNRALYFTNTSKLAKEVLGSEDKTACPINLDTIYSHFHQLLSATSENPVCNPAMTYRYERQLNAPPTIESAQTAQITRKMNKSSASGVVRVTYLGLAPFQQLNFQSVINKIDNAVYVLKSSGLSPTQTIHILNDFYLPSILYECTASDLSVTALKSIDRAWRKHVKQILHIPLFTNNGFIHLPPRLSGLGIRSIAYEVASARIRVYKHILENFEPFANESLRSELISAKKSIRPEYDERLSINENHLQAQIQAWSASKSQACGVELFTSGNAPPSNLIGLESYQRLLFCIALKLRDQ
ncbi:hypothetical protein GJ496_010037 [Pomphorhynchus laevis]|nr:hypothetical protein GJ496_010037 [Pomphorhynchus laevis]